MSHRVHNALAAALAAAVAVGLSAPAASAAGHHQIAAHGHHVERADHAEHGHGHADKLGKRAAAQQRQLVREIARLDARLSSVVRADRLVGLSADQVAAVVANVATDRTALGALRDSVLAAGGSADLRAVLSSLRQVRPEAYIVALVELRQADRLQATVDQNAADLGAVTDRDVSSGVDANDQAATALADAVAKALAVTAKSPKADLRGISADLQTARRALETVADVLVGTDDEAGTDETDPTDPADSTDSADPADPTDPEA